MENKYSNEKVNSEKTNGGFNMLNKLKKQIKNEKGLTLIELLAVIVIIAIIAAIAIPAIGNIITNSKANAAKADALNVLSAGQLYFTDNVDAASVEVEKLEDDGYLDSAGAIPEDATISKGTSDIANNLTADEITYSSGKTIKFTSATVNGINNNKDKGSKVDDIVIND